MTETKQMLLIEEEEISNIINIKGEYNVEIELQQKLATEIQKEFKNLVLIRDWSFENMVGDKIRRKHDLVFLDLSEFPPNFWIMEVKNRYAMPDDPFYFLFEALEREEIWNQYGVNDTKPFSITYAPSELQQNSLLSAYCAIMSFLRKSQINQEYGELYIKIQTLDDKTLWGSFDKEELQRMSYKEVKKELSKRNIIRGGPKNELIKTLLKFQKDLVRREYSSLIGIDVEINNQAWSLKNGINSIRLFKRNRYIDVIINPPEIPKIISKLVTLSNKQGGSAYWLWNMKENISKEYSKLTELELEHLKHEGMMWDGTQFGIFVLQLSQSNLKHHENLEAVNTYFSEYVDSWDLLSRTV